MGVQHNEEDVQPYLCMHSKAASFLLPNWETIWNVGLDHVVCNDGIVVVTCKEYVKGQLFLAAVRTDGKVHVLYTITKRQPAPLCSTYPAPYCSTQKCKHFRRYEEIVNNEGFTELFNPTFGRNIGSHDEFDKQELNEEESEEAEDMAETDETEETGETGETGETEVDGSESEHYLREPTQAEFSKMCGYNYSKILFTFKRSKSMQSTWVKRQMHVYDFPESFIPEYSENDACELHGHRYDENDDNLIVDTENCISYSEIGEQVFETKVMCRRTLGNCNCRQRYDGHPQLLWYLGKGKFINYSVPVNLHHNFVNGRLSIHAQFESIQDNAESFGVSCSLSYDDLHGASVGFSWNLQFDLKTAFSCPKHGVKPKWIVADGKNLGPTKRKCKDMAELDSG